MPSDHPRDRHLRSEASRAFTLIELLVVIGVIALLIGLLLPALQRARTAGWQLVSLSNCRQITAAAMVYRESNKGFMPLSTVHRTGSFRPTTISAQPPAQRYVDYRGWCTWSFGGQNVSPEAAALNGGSYDLHAIDRPLNPYIYPDAAFNAPPLGVAFQASSPERRAKLTPVFRDPGDKLSFQRFPFPSPARNGLSSYEDIGTSYHWNAKWWQQFEDAGLTGGNQNAVKSFDVGTKRLQLGEAFVTSKMVWVNDQNCDMVVNSRDASFKYKNGFGDTNKAVLGFLDGHAAYHEIYPGRSRQSFLNDKYQFIFEDLAIPR